MGKKTQEGSKRLKSVSRRFKKAQEGLRRLKKVQAGSRMFNEGSRIKGARMY